MTRLVVLAGAAVLCVVVLTLPRSVRSVRLRHNRVEVSMIEDIAPLVAAYWTARGTCPSWEHVEGLAITLTQHPTCTTVPQDPCVFYDDAVDGVDDCVFKIPYGFDDYYLYLVRRDMWLYSDEVFEGALGRLP